MSTTLIHLFDPTTGQYLESRTVNSRSPIPSNSTAKEMKEGDNHFTGARWIHNPAFVSSEETTDHEESHAEAT